MHVYAPGAQGYIPIQLQIDPSPNYVTQQVAYPKSEKLFLAPIKDTLDVYQGKFRVSEDITLADINVLQPVLAAGGELKIKGQLRYQACDNKQCFLPKNIPLEWTLKLEPQDRERSPDPILHKNAASPN